MAFFGRDDDAYYPIVLPGFLFYEGNNTLGGRDIGAMPGLYREPAGELDEGGIHGKELDWGDRVGLGIPGPESDW